MTNRQYTPRIAFSVTNCICHDQRVLKMAGIVRNLGGEVTIIGRKMGSCCEHSDTSFRTRRFIMIFKKGFLFYKFYNIRLFFYLLFHRFDILVANDLDTLPANFLVSKLKGKIIVFDSHEYFTGVPEVERRPFVKWVWKSFEKAILPGLKYSMTVSGSIAEQYFAEYNLRPVVVRNCSMRSDHITPYSKEELGINPDHLLLILQGTGINRERGGEELIDSLLLVENVSLLIVGSGDLLPVLKEKVTKNNLTDNVKFFPKLPWEEMMKFTKSADAGISLDKNTSINQRFSLPNKLFDYISAGIPVIAGNLPEVTKIITGHSCGIIIPEITPGEISQALKLLNANRDLLNVMKQNAKETAEILNWDIESGKVTDFYMSIMIKD